MKNQGTEFEREIAKSFEGYAAGDMAIMAMMPVPTRVAGMRGKVPMRVTTGKAPFDVYGYLLADGRMIGAELKSSKRKPSLAIFPPGHKGGGGVLYHQLDALAGLALAGGIARIVWDNDGETGVLYGSDIIVAWRAYMEGMKSKASGRSVPKGVCSIRWELFTPIDYTNLHGVVAIDWLHQEKG